MKNRFQRAFNALRACECGQPDLAIKELDGKGVTFTRYRIECTHCGTAVVGDTPQDAFDSWNKSPGAPVETAEPPKASVTRLHHTLPVSAEIMTALATFETGLIAAIDRANADGLPRGFLSSLLNAYALQENQKILPRSES